MNGTDQRIQLFQDEIVGRVLEVGDNVSSYKAGDLVGVGCLVDSCQTCSLVSKI
jgi:uncharacterized zinc-type alcohol dehydrogenase-like protein